MKNIYHQFSLQCQVLHIVLKIISELKKHIAKRIQYLNFFLRLQKLISNILVQKILKLA